MKGLCDERPLREESCATDKWTCHATSPRNSDVTQMSVGQPLIGPDRPIQIQDKRLIIACGYLKLDHFLLPAREIIPTWKNSHERFINRGIWVI